jgi:hypothetical protein
MEITWEIFFCSFSSLFQIFCVKRPDGAPVCPDGDSGCLDDTVDSFGRPFFLSGQACLYDLLRGTTSGCHLSYVRTVNPVGLNRILPGPAHHFLLSFGSFCHLVHFFCTFYAYFSSARVIFAIYLHPRYFLYSFTNLF